MEVTAGDALNRASQSSTPAAAGKLSLPGKRINFALKYFFIYLTRSTATSALTPMTFSSAFLGLECSTKGS